MTFSSHMKTFKQEKGWGLHLLIHLDLVSDTCHVFSEQALFATNGFNHSLINASFIILCLWSVNSNPNPRP